eukprot:TRINITY_DN3569_c0_g1_i15.p1 TRINITY_DN3569_c0_g1~~TRINITY_DN3569_c0_g1_i15.p1  ORF type:complete len:1211 (-),score=210.01 TRINITY_DN3569_c0_g1_i15:58-3690(-)
MHHTSTISAVAQACPVSEDSREQQLQVAQPQGGTSRAGRRRGTTDCSVNVATDGIAMHTLLVAAPLNARYSVAPTVTTQPQVSLWDFGGQAVYLPTHQFFLTPNSVFLLVFNCAKLDFEPTDYWMHQLQNLGGDDNGSVITSPIYLVGTHTDNTLCTQELLTEIAASLSHRYPKYRFPNVEGVFFVSCKLGTGIADLKSQVLTASCGEGVIVSSSWIMLSSIIAAEKAEYTTWSSYVATAERCSVDSSALPLVTNFLRGVGSIIHFGGSHLDDLVILHPQWLAQVMANLVTARHTWCKNGRMSAVTLVQAFENKEPQNVINAVVQLLEKLEVIYHVRDTDELFVPCLLPEEPHPLSFVWPRPLPQHTAEYRRLYCFQFLPVGFASRLLCRLMHLPSLILTHTWRNGALINMNLCAALLVFDHYHMRLHVRCPFDKVTTLLSIVVAQVDSLLAGFYSGIAASTRRYAACTHCIQKRSLVAEPYLFSFDECVTAAKERITFLFCNNIKSPERAVLVAQVAPDLAFAEANCFGRGRVMKSTLLGQGAYGAVFRGVLDGTTPVAIKEIVLLKDGSSDSSGGVSGTVAASSAVTVSSDEIQQAFIDFRHETFLMSCLDHPNLVKLHGITLDPLAMILENCPGGDLHHFLKVNPQHCSLAFRLKVACDIAHGMEYLHSLSPPIVHHDLRSPNVFLMINPERGGYSPSAAVAKIANFGLSVMAHTTPNSTETWQWSAPEVIDPRTKMYSVRSDIYSFGMILWELFNPPLLPFEELLDDNSKCRSDEKPLLDLISIKKAIIEKDLRPTLPSLPANLHALVTRCWSRIPAQRPPFSEIAASLADLTGGCVVPVSASTPSMSDSPGVSPPTSRKWRGCTPPSAAPRPLAASGSPLVTSRGSALLSIVAPAAKKLFRLQQAFPAPEKSLLVITCGEGIIFVKRTGDLFSFSRQENHELFYYRCDAQLGATDINTAVLSEYGDLWCFTAQGKIYVLNTETLSVFDHWIADKSGIVCGLTHAEHIWVGYANGCVQVWDAGTRDMASNHFSVAQKAISNLLEHNGTVIATSRSDVYVLKKESSSRVIRTTCTWVAHQADITAAASCAGFLWTGSALGEVCVWDYNPQTLEVRSLLKLASVHTDRITSFLFASLPTQQQSTSKRTVWSTSADARMVVWDAATFTPVQEIDKHTAPVLGAVRYCCGDMCAVVSVDRDSLCCVWVAV